jgi:hypothetical protein
MPPEGVRRSSRIPKEIGILLTGSDMEGKVFSEETKTVLLSRHGAGIVSTYKLSAEQELILRRLDTNKEAEVRVVGQLGCESDLYTYGVAFLDSAVNFWGIKFPVPSDTEKKASVVSMMCSGCDTRETVEHSDLESDVYLVNEGIMRYCRQCGSSTFWKRALDVVEVDPTRLPVRVEVEEPSISAVTPAEESPVPETVAVTVEDAKPAARAENRRKHVRTKVSFKACVRSFTFGDDIVSCEDISRGGLRFKSRKPYTQNTEIEVAAPYSPGTQNIFVRGKIVHVVELKEERSYRCGVEYAGRSKH